MRSIEIAFLFAMEHLTQIVRPKNQVVMELICRLKVRGLKGAGHDELPREVILPRWLDATMNDHDLKVVAGSEGF